MREPQVRRQVSQGLQEERPGLAALCPVSSHPERNHPPVHPRLVPETKTVVLAGLHLRTPTNGPQGTTRGGRIAIARQRKMHRELAYWQIASSYPIGALSRPGGLWTVTFTRIAPRELDDDNLRSSFKSIRDGVADAFGCSDRDPRLLFEYAQERGRPHEYAVRITITPRS